MKEFPSYDLEAITFGLDRQTFERAVDLYEKGKVTKFKSLGRGYEAVVLGGNPYNVYVSARHYDVGDCTCYLGQDEVLCKHMIAVAIYAILGGKPFPKAAMEYEEVPHASNVLGTLKRDELLEVKGQITKAIRHIKAYEGPSRTWFAYQDALSEGCRRLSTIFSKLPVGEQTARIVIEAPLRLDNRLSTGGVDDSDGTVGGFIEASVAMLLAYAALDPACETAFSILENRETCFGWEEALISAVSVKKNYLHQTPKRLKKKNR